MDWGVYDHELNRPGCDVRDVGFNKCFPALQRLPRPAHHCCLPGFIEEMNGYLTLGHLRGEMQAEDNLNRVFRCGGCD